MRSQQGTSKKPDKKFKQADGIIQDDRGVVWIPDDDNLLKLRILVAGHTGMCGHRGWTASKASIEAHFTWTGLAPDVESFVKSCIHCLCSEPGKVVPRPLGHTMHASERNQILHFDFCYMMPGEEDSLYVLILKDDLSGYVWLVPAADADADTVADALLRWFAAFGVVKTWLSDRGSHFKNEIVRLLKESTKSPITSPCILPVEQWDSRGCLQGTCPSD